MEEDKIQDKFIEISELFLEYVKILPNIELQNNEIFSGKHFKLRNQLDESSSAFEIIAMIFFELQYLLHRYNEKSDTGEYSMLISKLILSPKIPNTAFRQGFMIKIGYDKI